ncbi:hypothetical protein J4E06_07105 [Muricauda sp. NFXS6]|uniref:hypothetical protein n=1 Tax=Allomuricauda sp. NFXS6 TaxID=2819094 RepID=UPI0032DFEEF9
MGGTLIFNGMEGNIGDLFLALLIFGVSFIVVATLIDVLGSKFKAQAKRKLAISLIKQYASKMTINTTVETAKQYVSLYFPPLRIEQLLNHAREIEKLIDITGANYIVAHFDDESRGIYAVSVDFRSQFKMPADAEPTGNTISGFMEYVKLFRVGGEKRDEDGGIIMWDGIKEGYFYKK